METVKPTKQFHFLQHGGEMGSLTRNHNWSLSSIGTPDNWPQSLRTTVSNLLLSRFPMFLWWGPDLIQFYNDAYRPSLGNEGKHPTALGQRGSECWPEIWPVIHPLIQQVLQTGNPTWMEDQLIPINRNGALEDVYWTFSYSLVLNDDDAPGGVLVTCMETTEAVKGRMQLQDNEVRFRNAIDQAPVAFGVTTGPDLIFHNINPPMLQLIHKKNKSDVLGKRLKDVLPELTSQPVFEAILNVLQTGETFTGTEVEVDLVEAGILHRGYFNITYSRINNLEGEPSVLHMATDVTAQVLVRRKTEESEAKLRAIINSAPTAMSVFIGPDLIIENANQLMIEVMAAGPDIEGKSFRQLLAGLVDEDQKFIRIIDSVRSTGQPFEAQEVEVFFKAEKKTRYFNINFIPLLDEAGAVYAVLDVSVDITAQVAARKKIEESETFSRTVLENSPDCMKIVDAEGRLQYMNSNGLCTMEIDDFSQFKNSFWKDLWGTENKQLVRDSITAALSGETVQFQAFCPTAKGTPKWWDVMLSPVQLPGTDEITSLISVSRDITEQINAQKKVEESEARFRSLIEEAPIPTALFVGRDMVIEVANKPVLDVWGKGDSVLGKPLAKALPELEGQPFLKILDEIYTTGKTFETKGAPAYLEVNGVAGTYYFDYTFKPLRNTSGEVYAIMDMAIEVTEQVVSRQKIEASQRTLLTLFNESPVGIATLSGDDSFVFETANNFYCMLVGRKPQDIIGKPMMEALPELEGQGFDDLLKGVIATGNAYTATEVPAQLLRDGRMETIYVNLTYQPRKEDQLVTGVLVVATDVTEQVLTLQRIEQNEKQLETALEQARLSKEAAELGTFDLDLTKGTMHWDDRCRILFGISHQQLVTYEKDFVEGLHPDDKDRILAVIEKSFKQAESNGEYDVEYRTIGAEDGVERWVRAKGKVYFDDNDKPLRFIGSVLDITPQVGARQQIESLVKQRTKELAAVNTALQTANKELQRSNANLEEFAHAASHDLKEPIRKITFFSHQLKEQLSDRLRDNEKFSFGRIEHATERMGNLIDDLLLYSHVSQRPHQTEAVDLGQKVGRVMEDLELDIAEKVAIIEVGNLPVVQGYRRQLQQLFQNLISNALKYSKAGVPPRITISAEQSKIDGKVYQVIKVADNGIGFEQQYADKIFQMFSRLHGKSEYSGTGVGLSIVKKVVENHNGFIQVQSTPGQGSDFKIFLPA